MAPILVGQWLETVVAEYATKLTHRELWLLPSVLRGRCSVRLLLPSSSGRGVRNRLLHGVATEITVALSIQPR